MLIDRLLFADQVPVMMKKSLDFKSSRHLLISSNISNMDTPGYKAHDINFETQLRQVMNLPGTISLKTTHEKHMGPSKMGIKMLDPEPFEQLEAAKSNGNNVDMDKEMTKLAENQIMYSAITQLMMKRGSTIRSAVTELPRQ